ncbi:MAG: SpoIIE family protein phosphatase [Opitutales bacterium]|nr:SpoIIE family protein phosphatase [Opitutales bacterium]
MDDSAQQQIAGVLNSLCEDLEISDPDLKSKILEAFNTVYDFGTEEHREKMIYLDHLMEHLDDRIYFKDLKSNFIFGNKAFVDNFGVKTMEDLHGKSDFDFFPRTLAQKKFEDEQEIIKNGVPVSKDEHDEQEEGTLRWSSTTKMPLTDDKGNIIGTFGLSRDITDKKLAEKELIAVAKDLQIKNDQIDADLNMARKLQTAFVPTSYPSFMWDLSMDRSALDFSHRYVPTEALAGDFFQVIPISNSRAGILICDVMGHGIRAALVTAILKGLVGELKLITPYPHVFLRKVNRSLISVFTQLDMSIFVTAFYGVIDLERGAFNYANAGHPLPVIKNGEQDTVKLIPSVGDGTDPALGLIDAFRYSYESTPISEGDSLYFHTDGITEIENEEGEEFGMERYLESITRNRKQSSDGLLDALMSEIDKFSKNSRVLKDDMCVVGVDINRTVPQDK